MARVYKRNTLEDYEITPKGEIINKATGHVLKGQKNSKGYLRVCIGKKFYFVHRLVAEKYVKNPSGKEQVNHIDGNKLNNSADNLEWVTNKENREHAVKEGLHLTGEKCPWHKLKKEDIVYILSHPECTSTELSKLFSVNPRTIRDVRNHKTWKQLKSYAELARIESVRSRG